MLCGVDNSTAALLAQLTGLEALSIAWHSSINDAGLLQLTSLRRLSQLWVHGDLSLQLAPSIFISLQCKVGEGICGWRIRGLSSKP